jgi:hypothetical protein
VCIFLLVLCVFLQLRYLNVSLLKANALLVVPVYQVFWVRPAVGLCGSGGGGCSGSAVALWSGQGVPGRECPAALRAHDGPVRAFRFCYLSRRCS